MSDEAESVFDLNTVREQESAREIGSSPDADLHVDPLAPPEFALEAPARGWRVAKALERLRTQIDAAYPRRSKARRHHRRCRACEPLVGP